MITDSQLFKKMLATGEEQFGKIASQLITNEKFVASVQTAVTTARRRGLTVSICGQAPSVYPEVTERLVERGATSVSVSPDMIDQTREIIADAET